MGKIREFLKKHAWVSYLLLATLAALDALVSIVFLYPNDFAPVGLQGFTTMIQYLFGISVGYIYSLVNAPMLIIAFFVLSRGYSFKNLSYILSFSAMTVVFQKLIEGLDLNWVEYVAVEPEQKIFAAVVYGVLFGVTYPLAVWLGGSTGGTDIAALMDWYDVIVFSNHEDIVLH